MLFKVWILDFGDWAALLRTLNILNPAERVIVNGRPRFLWQGPGITLTTYSNPITGEWQQGVLPDGFGHVSYCGIQGDEVMVNAAIGAIKKYTMYVSSGLKWKKPE